MTYNAPDNFSNENSSQSAGRDLRILKRHDNIITVTDSAAAKLQTFRTDATDDRPFRIKAEINEENPCFLYYEMHPTDTWNPDHDVLCVASGIDFVLDELTVVRMSGTTLTWEDHASEQGFSFKNPSWPRTDLSREPWQDDVTEEVATALLQRSTQKKSRPKIVELPQGRDRSGMGAGAGIVGVILLGMLLRIPGALMRNADNRPQQVQPNPQALQFETDRLQEQIRQGEDVSDALLILSGIDPEEYKEYQRRIQESKLMEKSNDLAQQGLYEQAVLSLDEILIEAPHTAAFHNSKAWILATCPDDAVRDGAAAIEHAKKACELTEWTNASYLDTLAASYAEADDFESAIEHMQKAIDLVEDDAQKQRFTTRLELFQSKQPYRNGVPPQRVEVDN